MDIFTVARQCLVATEVEQKLALTKQAVEDWRQGLLTHTVDDVVVANALVDEQSATEQPVAESVTAGLPEGLVLVSPKSLPKRVINTIEGRAALYHAIAHIEFSAINLAWDAIVRFSGMPREYYADWVHVAGEEAYHFTLLRDYLLTLGYDYGDLPAHNGLWAMAEKSAHDVLVRMALIPRTLEARGLDVNPAIRAKLVAIDDQRGIEILDIILRDEIGHVAIGNHWFHYLCRQRGQDAEQTYRDLIDQYMAGKLRGPFHLEARRKAGFSEAELEYLQNL